MIGPDNQDTGPETLNWDEEGWDLSSAEREDWLDFKLWEMEQGLSTQPREGWDD